MGQAIRVARSGGRTGLDWMGRYLGRDTSCTINAYHTAPTTQKSAFQGLGWAGQKGLNGGGCELRIIAGGLHKSTHRERRLVEKRSRGVLAFVVLLLFF